MIIFILDIFKKAIINNFGYFIDWFYKFRWEDYIFKIIDNKIRLNNNYINNINKDIYDYIDIWRILY